MDKTSKIKKEDLVYIDESGVDLTVWKKRAWVKRGEVAIGKKSGQYYKRINMVAGLSGKKVIAPFIFNGTCNTALFNAWVDQFLVKELRPGQVVVMDNASFHKSPETRELIEKAGCKLLFLPPYSPDFNPIEKYWAVLKRWVGSHLDSFGSLFETLCAFFCAA